MAKNSRHWRWLYRNEDLSLRFANRLSAAGYPSSVAYRYEVIKPHRVTGTKIFEVATRAPYEVLRQAIGGLGTGLSRLADGTYEVWYG